VEVVATPRGDRILRRGAAMKAKRPNTQLWYVGLALEPGGPVVLVSANPIEQPCVETRRIRSITAKAAGRRYARNNVATALASAHYGTTNPASAAYRDLKPGMAKDFKGTAQNTPVRVLT
jgi:hypothetical protein